MNTRRRYRHHHRIGLTLALVALLTSTIILTGGGCAGHAPPSLSGPGVRDYYANEVTIAIGTVQHAAIDLNKAQVCTPAPCHPILSNHNTGIVVDAATDALTTIKATPDGALATAVAAIDRMQARLDAAGKQEIAAYLGAARTIITELQKGRR